MTYDQAFRIFTEKRSGAENPWYKSFPGFPAKDLEASQIRDHLFGETKDATGLVEYFTAKESEKTTMDAETFLVGRILLKGMLEELIKRKRISNSLAEKIKELLQLDGIESEDGKEPTAL